jgi:hypothetical protein
MFAPMLRIRAAPGSGLRKILYDVFWILVLLLAPSPHYTPLEMVFWILVLLLALVCACSWSWRCCW